MWQVMFQHCTTDDVFEMCVKIRRFLTMFALHCIHTIIFEGTSKTQKLHGCAFTSKFFSVVFACWVSFLNNSIQQYNKYKTGPVVLLFSAVNAGTTYTYTLNGGTPQSGSLANAGSWVAFYTSSSDFVFINASGPVLVAQFSRVFMLISWSLLDKKAPFIQDVSRLICTEREFVRVNRARIWSASAAGILGYS